MACSRSQFSKTAPDRFASTKSTSRRLQFLNTVFFMLRLKNELKFIWQFSKPTENNNSLQCSKCTPRSLQSMNFTSLKVVWLVFIMERFDPVNSQSEKIMPEKSLSAKLHCLKLQPSYSPFGNPF